MTCIWDYGGVLATLAACDVRDVGAGLYVLDDDMTADHPDVDAAALALGWSVTNTYGPDFQFTPQATGGVTGLASVTTGWRPRTVRPSAQLRCARPPVPRLLDGPGSPSNRRTPCIRGPRGDGLRYG